MMSGLRPPILLLLAAGMALFLAPEPVLAQCSMCRMALEQNPEAAAGFNRGILFLLVMPYALFAAGAFFVLRHRRARRTAPAPRPHAATDFAPAGP